MDMKVCQGDSSSIDRKKTITDLQELMHLFPDLHSIAEMYFRCKLCNDAQIHCGVQMFLQHIEIEHPNYGTNSIAEDDVVTRTVTSHQKNIKQETSHAKSSLPVKRFQSRVDQDSVSLKRRCNSKSSELLHDHSISKNNQGNDHDNVKIPQSKDSNWNQYNLIDQTAVNNISQKQEHVIELVPENSQLITDHQPQHNTDIAHTKSETDYLLSSSSIDPGNVENVLVVQTTVGDNTKSFNNIITNKSLISSTTVGEMDQICNNAPVLTQSQTLDDNQIVHSFQMKPTCGESKHEIHNEEANNLIYHVITEGQDGEVEESHFVDAIFPENMKDHPTLNYQEMPCGTVIQSHNHSVIHQQPINSQSEDGNTIIVTNVPVSSMSRGKATSTEIISRLANNVQRTHTSNIQTNVGTLHMHQEPQYKSQSVVVPVYQQEIYEQQTIQPDENIGKDQHQTEIDDTYNVEVPEISSGLTSTYQPGTNAFEVQLDEIPRRGRPPNWMKQVECTATKYELPFSLSSVPSPGVLHRGPLHHKDRVQETLMRCTHNNPQLCQYVVLGEHYHCRACRGVVGEDDLIVHRYVHSTVRLLADVNIQQVVANGQFCEDLNCGEKDTGKSGRSSVIHMHCNNCQEILETGHKFHEHLKICHPDIWHQCLIYDESETDSEQCMLCRGYYGSLEYLTKHMTDRHFAKYRVKEMQASCIVCCGLKFQQIEPYRIHIAVHHKTLNAALLKHQFLPLHCLECGEDLVGKQTLYKHQWAMHKKNPDNRTCSLCNSTFSSLQKLQQHSLDKHKKDQFPCADCGKNFQTKATFSQHFVMTHAKKYNYSCEECGQGFFGEFQYLSHRDNKHQGHRSNYVEYMCESGCGKNFVQHKSLLKHQTVCLIFATKEYLQKK